MFKTILVASDGSEAAGRAVDTAIDLAIKYASRLCIVHVHLHGRPVEELERMAEVEHIVPTMSVRASASAVPSSTTLRDALLEAQHEGLVVSKLGDLILARAQQQAQDAGVQQVEVISASGDYGDGILDAIDDTAAELVIMGRRGLGRLRQMLIGSVSSKVLQHSGVAVMLIP